MVKHPEDDLPDTVHPAPLGGTRDARKRVVEDEVAAIRAEVDARTEELADCLAALQATLASTSDGILVMNARREITAFNEKFLQVWELSAIPAEGGDIEQLQAELRRRSAVQSQPLFDDMFEISLSPPDFHGILELADGRTLECRSRTHSVNGKNVSRVWSFRDISASRRAENALREQRHTLEVLNRTGAILSSQLSMEVVVQTVTDAAKDLSGAKFAAFFYNNLDENGESYMLYTLSGAPREAFEKFGQPRSTPLFAQTFRGEAVIRCDDVLQDPRYGKMPPHYGMPPGHLPVRSYLAVPVISRWGEVIGGLFFGHPESGRFSEKTEALMVGVAAQAAIAIDNARLYQSAQRSAEERKKLLESERLARESAELASKMKDEFLAILSHELRTPLSAILGWSQILRDSVKDQGMIGRALDTIERNARAQTQLIEDLLDMSRITSGKVHLDMQPVAPVSFVEAAITTMLPAAETKEIVVERSFDPNTGPITGDPTRLQQVVWNLLSNAIKFTPRGGRVQVRVQNVQSRVEISVSDTGVGIRPEFLPYIFDRFRQADSSPTRSHGGLGLGLSIVKSLVELHGGSVRVESAGENMGTTFVLSLPRADRYSRPIHTSASQTSDPLVPTAFVKVDLTGVRVLVVDDEVDARDLMTHVLVMCGATVFSAADAKEALDLVRRERPDVMVCDIGMPCVDGYELLRRVRALGEAAGGNTAAIAVTAFARAEDRTRALRAGFLVHVAKPVDPSEIVVIVARVAARKP